MHAAAWPCTLLTLATTLTLVLIVTPPASATLNIHMICHTHDDVGWLKTRTEYYYGANNSIQAAGVQYILDSVIPALVANPERKFIYVEQAFFSMWWYEQSAAMQEVVRGLVARGQLTFVEGGWVMPDEANPTWSDWVDALTLGQRFIATEFGQPASVAASEVLWQIDPFGHSRSVALAAAAGGANLAVLGRIDYDDMAHREATKTMEFVWKTSPSLGPSADLFTLKTFNGYGPPDSYCFDIFCTSPPVQDDPRLEGVNVKERADGFVAAAKTWAVPYTSNNVMLTMGSDFQYQNANTWFSNLDKLMTYIQAHAEEYDVNIFYSTPQMYVDYVHAAGLNYTTKADDFFPYADFPAAYWSGYFTSRPALKGYVRSCSAALRSCRQLEIAALATAVEPVTASSFALWDAQGVLQHHDAVAGTEKQHVAYDYAKQLAIGHTECAALAADALALITERSFSGDVFASCPRANVSLCPPTQVLPSPSGPGIAVVVYNQLAIPTSSWERVPVDSTSWAVVNATGHPVPAQIVPNPPPLLDRPAASKYTLVFYAPDVPPLGYATYFMVGTTSARAAPLADSAALPPSALRTSADNEYVSLTFGDNGLLESYTDKVSGVTTKLSQRIAFYNASAGPHQPDPPALNPNQASGAYIFRPNSTQLFTLGRDVAVTVHSGPHGTEIVQTFGAWAYQVVRLYAGDRVPSVEYTVGPIDIDDGCGKEVVSVWATDLDTAAKWTTDANGREMIERRRFHRDTWTLNCTQTVACNYVPVNTAAYIEDASGGGTRFTVISDRSNGGASMADGELELMVHRRLLFDDGRGVGEALNETGITGVGLIIRSTHLFFAAPSASASALQRSLVRQHSYPHSLFFAPMAGTPAEWAAAHRTDFSALARPLPPQVFLQTLQALDSGPTLLLRLSHMYAVNESSVYSVPVSVDVSGLFKAFTISSWTELALTANQPVTNLANRYTWNTAGGPEHDPAAAARAARPTSGPGASFVVALDPMETRTFELHVSWSSLAPSAARP